MCKDNTCGTVGYDVGEDFARMHLAAIKQANGYYALFD
jgi:hypothetical protein